MDDQKFYSQDFKRQIIAEIEKYSLFNLYMDIKDEIKDEKEWVIHHLSANPNITMEIVKANPEIQWNRYGLVSNPNFTPKMYLELELDQTENVSFNEYLPAYAKNPHADIDIVLERLRADIDEFEECFGVIGNLFRYNSCITLEILDKVCQIYHYRDPLSFKEGLYIRLLENIYCSDSDRKKISKHLLNSEHKTEFIKRWKVSDDGKIERTKPPPTLHVPWEYYRDNREKINHIDLFKCKGLYDPFVFRKYMEEKYSLARTELLNAGLSEDVIGAVVGSYITGKDMQE